MTMKGTLLIVVILCTTALALSLNHRFVRETKKIICDPETPCAWDIYKGGLKTEEIVKNEYCVCPGDRECLSEVHDDISAHFVVRRCKLLIT